ncbi:tRNA (adenosine(37)-N6)-dimethylallyltransferase MiaA [Peribacillus alkalitolerans]|uniref:tRNA (adenosine(37)-N6)-dimethylallyltransferase MiaA n=1 Tax=Peribacillus alkalitolerans TaxID=1550385 RepID=UPI0013D189ED|nr:tRNA (adenosine(37)-N6)-dimethylallyltransferase MiaA [Peribacillus alkalitolerans]
MKEKQKIIVIIGPTAVGKTKLSVELAKRFNGEIISGDSMQIYRGMDIGTAKITPEEMEGIPHHLIDIKEPKEPFNAAEFQELASKEIINIANRGKIPIIAGGTGLYIQSLLFQYEFSEAVSDPEFRHKWEEIAHQKGEEFVHERLKEVDPESASRIHPNNIRRVIRALEIYHLTGITMTDTLQAQTMHSDYDYILIGLDMDRELLYDRINKRVDIMMEEGLLNEVKELFNQGVREVQSIQAIGYKEIYEFLDGKCSLEAAVEKLKQNSRRYAKRQLTWFRNKMDVFWFDVSNVEDFQKKVIEISHFIEGKLQLKSNT